MSSQFSPSVPQNLAALLDEVVSLRHQLAARERPGLPIVIKVETVPVIWATQVLETLAKDGVIDRPEITDAAMSVRADCVMMNEGPFITDAVVILNDILTRMDAHQYKKVSRLRRLHW